MRKKIQAEIIWMKMKAEKKTKYFNISKSQKYKTKFHWHQQKLTVFLVPAYIPLATVCLIIENIMRRRKKKLYSLHVQQRQIEYEWMNEWKSFIGSSYQNGIVVNIFMNT